jgi:hypothetical protein
MQKREAPDPETTTPSGATATPRASGERPLAALPSADTMESSAVSEPGAVSEPSDTLLSAGKPADRLELIIDDRLSGIEDRLRDLDARLAVLERKKTSIASETRQKPWLWIAFLIALVVVFQLLRRVR